MSVFKLTKPDLASLEEAKKKFAATGDGSAVRLTIHGLHNTDAGIMLTFGRSDRPNEMVDAMLVDRKTAAAIQSLINSLK